MMRVPAPLPCGSACTETISAPLPSTHHVTTPLRPLASSRQTMPSDVLGLVLSKHAHGRRPTRELAPVRLDLYSRRRPDVRLSHGHLRRGESMSVSASPSRLKESISEATTIVGANSSSG